MGTGIGARQPAMQSGRQAMSGRMQEPKRLQYGAQQYGGQQYGGMQNMQPGGQPWRTAMMPNSQQPQQTRPAVMPPNWQTQPFRPAPAVMPGDWQQIVQRPGAQPPPPAPAVMPGDWQQPGAQQRRFAMTVMPGDWQQQPALMQMMMQRK
jgi:hypothetical protein